MKKDFIKGLYAELAPTPDENAAGALLLPVSGTLTEAERRQAEQLAAAANMVFSKFVRVSVRRVLREAREAGVLAEKVTTPA